MTLLKYKNTVEGYKNHIFVVEISADTTPMLLSMLRLTFVNFEVTLIPKVKVWLYLKQLLVKLLCRAKLTASGFGKVFII